MRARNCIRKLVRTSLVGAVAVAIGGAACGDRDRDLVASAGGGPDSLRLSAPAFEHDVTSEDYRRWLVAEEALARVSGFRLADEIALESATDADVDRVADALEENEPVRRAIESSGLSVEDYVKTTVALEQALYASRPSTPRASPARADAFLADAHRADIERVRLASPLRVSRQADRDDDDEWDSDDDDRRKEKGRKRGKHKGRKKGKD